MLSNGQLFIQIQAGPRRLFPIPEGWCRRSKPGPGRAPYVLCGLISGKVHSKPRAPFRKSPYTSALDSGSWSPARWHLCFTAICLTSSRHPGSLEAGFSGPHRLSPPHRNAARSLQQGSQPKLTMSLSPTLLSLLVDPVLQERYEPWLQQRIELLQRSSSDEQAAAADLSSTWSGNARPSAAAGQCAQALCAAAAPRRSRPADLLCHPRLPAAAAGSQRCGARPTAHCGARARTPDWRSSPRYLAARMRLLRGPRSAASRPACVTPFSMPTAYCMPCPAPATGCMRRSARRVLWPSLAAIAKPPCRSGQPVTATRAIPATGSSIATLAGISKKTNCKPLASPAAPGLKLRRVSGGDCPLEAKLPMTQQPLSAPQPLGYVQARIKQLSELGAVMDQPPMVVAPLMRNSLAIGGLKVPAWSR